jgi:hypothetical protein
MSKLRYEAVFYIAVLKSEDTWKEPLLACDSHRDVFYAAEAQAQ